VTTLDELRNVADKLKKSHVKPIKLTKEQAELANNNVVYGGELFKKGDAVYFLDKHNPDML